MSYAADHHFWQQRVDKEVNERNKFIQNNFFKSQSDLINGNAYANTETYNMYEVGLSDPNAIKPREFKYVYRNVPVELSKNAYEKLKELTQTQANDMFLRRNSQLPDYVGYRTKGTNDPAEIKRAKSQFGLNKGSVGLQQNISQKIMNSGPQGQSQQTEEQKNIYGKKKRKRFNEELSETQSKKSGMFQVNSNANLTNKGKNHFQNEKQSYLNNDTLKTLPNAQKLMLDEELVSQITKSAHKLKPIDSKLILGKKQIAQKVNNDTISEKSQVYKEKILAILNQMDEKQLEKLGKDLNIQAGGDLLEGLIQNNITSEELANLDQRTVATDQIFSDDQQKVEDDKVSEAKSNLKSVKTTKSQITVLEKQLNEEKEARLKLKDEIEELKKMNQQLCTAILSQNQQKK